MKKILLPLSVAGIAVAAAVVSTKPQPLTEKWEKHQLSRYFWAEGACSADVNGDGETDVFSGPYWFQGPDFKTTHTIYPATQSFQLGEEKLEGFEGGLGKNNTYSDNFLSFAHDLSGDGKPDYIVCGYPGKETFWYENPVDKGGEWKRQTALAITDNESPMFVDVNGDKQQDLLCMSGGTVGYATYDAKNPSTEWTWHAVSEKDDGAYQRFTHGIGHGDINGDGRTDILEAKGWREAPADWDGKTPWKRHDIDFGTGGAQMYGYDVNADGRTDVITCLAAHEFGLCWFEQNEDATFTRHLLTGTPEEAGSTGVTFSQPHAIDIADLNGDGLMDIVTGKRFWAHGPDGDPEPNEAPVLYAFYLSRKDGKAAYTAEIIDDASGVGCQVMATDINKDGKPDILVGNKKGCYVHLQK